MREPYELLIFDWDGTLMDSTAAIAGALQDACADLALPVPPLREARYVIGLGLTDAMRHILPDLPESEYPKVVDRYRVHFLRRDGGTVLFDGARELIVELHARGYLLAVATGKSRRGLDRALRQTGLGTFFHFTRCADEGFAKPHPGMLTAILDMLAIPATNALMIGDTTHDLTMAGAAGVAAVAVTHGAHERQALAACNPVLMVGDLRGLRDWLLPQTESQAEF
jgi:phosphoglycolate phosphatase